MFESHANHTRLCSCNYMCRLQCHLFEHSTCKHHRSASACSVGSLLGYTCEFKYLITRLKVFVFSLMEQAAITAKGSTMRSYNSHEWILWRSSVERNILDDLIMGRRQATHFSLSEDPHGPGAPEMHTFIVHMLEAHPAPSLLESCWRISPLRRSGMHRSTASKCSV